MGENQLDNLQRDLLKGAPEDLTQLLDTSHFPRIIERNHAAAFSNEFLNLDHTLRLLRHLSTRRNEWAHVLDGQWELEDILQSVQAMREILISLRRREALEINRMFQDGLEQQGGLLEETLTQIPEPSESPEEVDGWNEEHSWLGFWRTLESYLVVESAIQSGEEQIDGRGRKLVNVLVRVTNVAPASEDRPNIRFRDVRLTIRRSNNNTESHMGSLEPGESREELLRVYEKEIASVEFEVQGDVDRKRLFFLRRRNALPDDVVTPMLLELREQFEGIGIEEAVEKVTISVAKIQPAMTLAEVSDLRRELTEFKQLIEGRREALGQLFREFHLSRESPLGSSLREAILLLEDMEKSKIPAMETAISNTDLESIRLVANNIEQLKISVLRIRDSIRERMGVRYL